MPACAELSFERLVSRHRTSGCPGLCMHFVVGPSPANVALVGSLATLATCRSDCASLSVRGGAVSGGSERCNTAIRSPVTATQGAPPCEVSCNMSSGTQMTLASCSERNSYKKCALYHD